MPSKSKQKGDKEERDVVNLHREERIEARRTLTSGARSDGEHTYDVDIYDKGVDWPPLVGECKIRARGFKQIYDWLGGNDFLTIRADRKPRLYVVTEETWLRLLKR